MDPLEMQLIPEDTRRRPQAGSARQLQGVQQLQISAGHSNKRFPPRHRYIEASLIDEILNRVVMELTDELVAREAFTHHDVNLLLKETVSSARKSF